MKRFLAVLLFFGFFLSPFIVKADSKNYSIENLVVNSTILKNGDVYVEEEITYNFNGDFNGIYRNYSKNGARDISISEVLVKDNQGKVYNISQDKGTNNNYYELENSKSTSKVKIYSKSNNERKTFIFKYTIHGGAVKREDFGELNWAFYEVENKVPVNNFELNVSLKTANFDMSIFKHWGYIDGKNLTDNYNEEGFQIKGQNLTGKLAVKVNFQTDYLDIPITKKGRKDIAGMVIFGAISAFVIGIIGYVFRKKEKFEAAVKAYRSKYVHFNGDLVTMAPIDMPPALVDLLINEQEVSNSAISSTLLYLCHKGYYTLEKDLCSNKEDTKDKKSKDLVFRRNYQLTLPQSTNLKYFIKWMSKYELDGVLSLKTIKDKVKTSSGCLDYRNTENQWKQIVKKEAKNLGFFVKIEEKPILSNEYYDLKLKWLAYKKYLLSYVDNKTMNSNQNKDSIENIDEILIYSSVLIGSKNKLEKLLDSINDFDYANSSFDNDFFYYYYPFYMTNYSMWYKISHEANYDYSSGDGGGFGGFSGGSSFSGGGGGGSGAF